jgi:hypothetical protein
MQRVGCAKAFTANKRIIIVFGKAKCKLCGESVRFALRHLKQKHSNIYDKEITKMKMPNIMEKYFT